SRRGIEFHSAEGTAMSRLLCLAVAAGLMTSIGCGEVDHTTRTIRALEKIGAKVTRDDQRPNEPVIGGDLRAAQVTDEDLAAVLCELTQLRDLDLSCTSVSDSGLKDIRELKHLRSLDLCCTRVSDRILEDVRELKHLRSLNLGFDQVSDA